MRFRDHSITKQAEMQLAPMIDVVFLLLIFFIVSWNFARFEAEIDISVPNAETAEVTPRAPGEIIINVNKTGDVKINGTLMSTEQLLERLLRLSKKFPNQPVILRGDKETAFTHVMKVLDTCQKAGIWNVAFAAEKPQEGSPATP
ncbi:MAG: biopolymer transport protein ExbD [Verrucomicrobiales bacterium]|jgi:biopolymer transport protein ExbD